MESHCRAKGCCNRMGSTNRLRTETGTQIVLTEPRNSLRELKGDSHQIWRTQRVQVNVASLRLFLRSSTRPNRAFQPQSLGRVRDPVRIAEGPGMVQNARHSGNSSAPLDGSGVLQRLLPAAERRNFIAWRREPQGRCRRERTTNSLDLSPQRGRPMNASRTRSRL